MMQVYPYTDIQCNGRRIALEDISIGTARGLNKFEDALFTFVREWLHGADYFELTTSGSTGSPKKIVVTRDQMIASARLTSDALGLTEGQTALVCLSPEFIAGKMMVVRSFVAGLQIIAVDPSSKPTEEVNQHIDLAAMVPLQVHDMLQDGSHAFHYLRTVIIGGGAIDAKDIAYLKDLRCRFFATYGMTETVSHVALRELNGEGASMYFHALPGITFTKDERGCLVIHWEALGGPVVTNDLVELNDDVQFVWLGRWDNVINSGGRKIIPEKLEASIVSALTAAGIDARFFVSSLPDERLGNKVVMILEGNYTNQIYSNLQTILQSSLQSHEVPKEFHAAPHFIETATGKVNRKASLELAILRNRSSD